MVGMKDRFGSVNRYSDLILASSIFCILFLLVIPLTDVALDTLISVSIVLSIVTLLVTIYSSEPLSFNSLPSFLLFLTLYRLALNIASTRMILTDGHAGKIIKTFGEVVTGGNEFVGFVIFLLLTGINFLVITKGSGRVAEVAARFTLDSLPGKQLSIDADVNAGLINEEEAKSRRDKIITEADFYGAMDGASKFVRGDAIAGIIIILVNLFGGLVVGMVMKGMSLDQVIHTYVTLTIGDGLVTQIPALLISVGAGIIVTRSSVGENLADSFRKQIFNNPKILNITATILLLMGFIPGMPLFVIAPIAFAIYLYAYSINTNQQFLLSESELQETHIHTRGLKGIEEADKTLFIDPMEIELGKDVATLANESMGGALLKRISIIRRQIAMELGLVIPSIRVIDNHILRANSYVIKIKGNEAASGVLRNNHFLAMHPNKGASPLKGIKTIEPAFGTPATWILPSEKEEALRKGYVLADPSTVLATHLAEVIRANASEFLNRQEVSALVENAKSYASAVIAELIPSKLSYGNLLRVLKNLLKERVSIRDFVSILEIIADNISSTNDPNLLSEYVRRGLARSITKEYINADNTLHAVVLHPSVEEILLESIQNTDFGKTLILPPKTIRNIINEAALYIQNASQKGLQPIFLTSPSLRPYFKMIVERKIPKIPVFSVDEIVSDVQVSNIGMISTEVLMQ
jgi:flagellar biosynthesis protein FlhA